MIDEKKYEGHTPAPWESDLDDEGNRWVDAYTDEGDNNICRITNGTRADAQLIADAPLLLEAYKRLRLVADELYLHIVGEPHMTLDELVAEMPWRNEE